MTVMLIAKVTLMLAVALALVATMRRATATTRHALLAATQAAVLLLPLLAHVMPAVHLSHEVADVVAMPMFDGREPAAAPVSGPVPAAVAVAEPPRFAFFFWIAGVVLILANRTLSYVRAMRVVRGATAWRDVLLSDEIDQPMTFGASVLLPRDATEWSAERVEAVLLHERAHVARHDTLLQAIGDVACAIYWFHPLVWVAARKARLERERACDDLVLAAGIGATDYAHALIDVARTAARHRVAGMAMAERSQLATRVHAVLDANHRRRSMRGARATAFAAMIAIAPLLAAVDTASIPRPRFGEPDRRGDSVASPWSEHIGAAPVQVAATGPDAAFIAYLQQLAERPPRHEIDFVADRARWALGRVANGELVAPLLASLSDRDWRVRAYAAWTLGLAADRRATPALAALMNDDVWRVRASAAASLHRLADPAAAYAMRRALSDDAWQVRSEAVRFFSAIGSDRELFEIMRRDRHMAVREAAEEAIR